MHIIAGIGLFVGSYLNDIIMNVVNNAAVSGYLKSNGHCGLDVLGKSTIGAMTLDMHTPPKYEAQGL